MNETQPRHGEPAENSASFFYSYHAWLSTRTDDIRRAEGFIPCRVCGPPAEGCPDCDGDGVVLFESLSDAGSLLYFSYDTYSEELIHTAKTLLEFPMFQQYKTFIELLADEGFAPATRFIPGHKNPRALRAKVVLGGRALN